MINRTTEHDGYAGMARALATMARDRERLNALIAPLSGDAMHAGRRGGWTIGRVLEHVIESEAMYAKLLAHLTSVDSPDLKVREPIDGNDAIGQLLVTRNSVEHLMFGISEEVLYRLVKVGHEEYSPLSVLENIALHDREHHDQVAEILSASRASRPQLGDSRPGTIAAPTAQIRYAMDADLARLTDIYNYYVVHTAVTFDLQTYSIEQRGAWFAQFDTSGRHRLLVAEVEGAVAGYAGSHQFRTKAAYETTVETTIYLAPEMTGHGIGAALYGALFDALRGEDIRSYVGGVTLPNDASVALHERFGFRRIGVMHEVGRKFGQYWDVAWFEKVGA